MTATITLWALGAVCLITAIVSAEAWVAGAKLPAPKTRGQRAGVAVIGVGLLILGFIVFFAQKSGNPKPVNLSGPGPSASQTTANGQASSPGSTRPSSTGGSTTPVWTSPNPILIPGGGGMGIDFDSNPPGPDTSPNTLFLYLGNYLQTDGNIRIATWTKNALPTRDQCDVLAQTQGNYEQPAELGGRYCLLTEQGHTAYLKITSIDASNTADIKAYADVIVWNTTG